MRNQHHFQYIFRVNNSSEISIFIIMKLQQIKSFNYPSYLTRRESKLKRQLYQCTAEIKRLNVMKCWGTIISTGSFLFVFMNRHFSSGNS